MWVRVCFLMVQNICHSSATCFIISYTASYRVEHKKSTKKALKDILVLLHKLKKWFTQTNFCLFHTLHSHVFVLPVTTLKLEVFISSWKQNIKASVCFQRLRSRISQRIFKVMRCILFKHCNENFCHVFFIHSFTMLLN